MLLWGPPFVWPKNKRFRHGFKKNLNKELIFPFFVLLCEILWCTSAINCMPPETIENFWPLRGFYVC